MRTAHLLALPAGGLAAVLLVTWCGQPAGTAPATTPSPSTFTTTEEPSVTTDPTPSDDPSTTPPLSAVPPPTMARPTGPPTRPSDSFSAVTLVGRGTRTSQGCVHLSTDAGAYELIGDRADEAVRSGRVLVTALPRPDVAPRCSDVPVLAVTAVASA